MKFITSLLPAMESTACMSSQAGRQMMRREKEEEEEEEKALGSSAKNKIKKINNRITIYTHTYKEIKSQLQLFVKINIHFFLYTVNVAQL